MKKVTKRNSRLAVNSLAAQGIYGEVRKTLDPHNLLAINASPYRRISLCRCWRSVCFKKRHSAWGSSSQDKRHCPHTSLFFCLQILQNYSLSILRLDSQKQHFQRFGLDWISLTFLKLKTWPFNLLSPLIHFPLSFLILSWVFVKVICFYFPCPHHHHPHKLHSHQDSSFII